MEQDSYVQSRTAVCIGPAVNAKSAALYFDHVLHLCIGPDIAPQEVWPEAFYKNRALKDRFTEFLYSLPFNHPTIGESFDDAFHVGAANTANNPTPYDILLPKNQDALNRLIEEAYIENAGNIRDEFLRVMSPLGVHQTPIVAEPDKLESKNKTLGDITVTLSNLRLVDVENTPWRQIIEFREDPDSVKALRRLRLFLFDTCREKSSAYVEDKLSAEIEKYENAVKSAGFKLTAGSFSAVIDAQALGAYATSVLAFLAGAGPVPALTGAAIVAGLKVGLQVYRDKYALRELKRDHGLAYLIDARERLEG
jgi:hypothetical protein